MPWPPQPRTVAPPPAVSDSLCTLFNFILFFFFNVGGFTTVVYPLNSFQMGLCFSSFLYAGSAQRLPTSRCRAGRSICRGFGRAGCPAAPACISPGSAQLGPGAPHKHHLALAGPWSPSQCWQPVRMDGWIDGWTDGRMGGEVNGRADGDTNGWSDGGMNGWRDE